MTARLLLLAAALFVVSTAARADYVVNTGAPANPNGGTLIGDYNIPEPQHQALATAFELTTETDIASVEVFLQLPRRSALTLVLSIAADDAGGTVPGTILFSDSYRYTAPVPTPTSPVYDWIGIFNLDWELDPGLYWLTMDAVSEPNGAAYFLAAYPSPNPLLFATAFRNTAAGNSWTPISQANTRGWGVRIASTVPEPATLALIALALAGLGFSRRKH